MKKLLGCLFVACLAVHSFAANGEQIFQRCAICHGEKAEKSFAGVPPINSLSPEQRMQYMRDYSEGKRNAYGNGALMKFNLRGLKEKDFQALEEYIKTLK